MRKDDTIFIPSHLEEIDIERALLKIAEFDKDNPEAMDDLVLVDELNGNINIKYLKRDEIQKKADESGITPYEVVMNIMRLQNKDQQS